MRSLVRTGNESIDFSFVIGATMKYIEVAERTLRENERAMHSTEIIAYAKKRGWISPRGKTPDHSLQAAIWRDMKERGRNSPFVMTSGRTLRRKYALRSLEKN
jgi:hypothetical protein